MADKLPQHIGIIMDGNRRWAKMHSLPVNEGHSRGREVLREIVKHVFEKGIPYLSVYAFSLENWRRTQDEVRYLMSLVQRTLDKYMDEFNEAGVKVIFLGTKDKLDKKVIRAIEEAETKTQNNKKGTLAICFNYSGQQEIIDAVKHLTKEGVDADSLTIEKLGSKLYHPEIPPLDLIIRTSGEQRLSGFMLWRSAYAEFIFMERHWPDFRPADVDRALAEFANRQRRYGQ